MARLARLTIPGLPHHILQSGAGVPVFRSDDDCLFYIGAACSALAPGSPVCAVRLSAPSGKRAADRVAAVSFLSQHLYAAAFPRYAVWYNRVHSHTGLSGRGGFTRRCLSRRRFRSSLYIWRGCRCERGL